MKYSPKSLTGKLMLQRAFCNSLVRENDEITFWKSTNEKESLAKLCARNGIAYIKYNKKIFLSFNKFMKAYLKVFANFNKRVFNDFNCTNYMLATDKPFSISKTTFQFFYRR